MRNEGNVPHYDKPARPEAAGDHPAGGPELRGRRATRCAGRTGASASASRRARGSSCTPRLRGPGRLRPILYRASISRDGRAVRRPEPDARSGRAPSTSASTAWARRSNTPRAGLRLPRRDPLLRRRARTTGRRGRTRQERDLHARGGLRHPLEAHRLPHGRRRGPPFAPPGHLVLLDVGNYDYGFFWYLYQDGTIQFEVKLTGIMSMGASPAGRRPADTASSAPPACTRPTTSTSSTSGSTWTSTAARTRSYEVDIVPDPLGPGEPLRQRMARPATPLTSESEAQRGHRSARRRALLEDRQPRTRSNRVGEPVGYKLLPGENVHHTVPRRTLPVAQARRLRHPPPLGDASTTPRERYAAGDYPNQSRRWRGLPECVDAGPSARGRGRRALVHLRRPPRRPPRGLARDARLLHRLHLKPSGFFDRNPALDVPAPARACHTH